jgi:hypothetical protein
LTSVVSETHFPKPAGGDTARFDWGMMVESAVGQPAPSLDPDLLKPLLKRRAPALFRSCGVDRSREHFKITAYVARGHVLSAGAVASPSRAESKVDCVLEEFASWRMPKRAQHGKLTFDLR